MNRFRLYPTFAQMVGTSHIESGWLFFCSWQKSAPAEVDSRSKIWVATTSRSKVSTSGFGCFHSSSCGFGA